MVNQIIFNYLIKWKDKYKLEDLKKKIISSGYSEEDVDEAVIILGLGQEKQEKTGEVEKIKPAKTHVSNDAKLLKLAGICGILVFVFAILAGVFGISNLISLIFSSLSGVSMAIFYYGFFILGKKYNKKLLKIMSVIFIIFVALVIIGNILVFLFSDDVDNVIAQKVSSIGIQNFALENIVSSVITTLLIYFVIILILVLVMIVLGILFGAGVLKLKEDIALAKAAGILYIIGYISLIIGIGALLLLVAHILAIVMMFKVSK